jgi:hypothetical protein
MRVPAALRPPVSLAMLAVLALTSACTNVRYDLGDLPFPVSASPVRGAHGDRFVLHDHYVLWLHGLAGERQPDVAGGLLANCLPCAGIADFRVETSSSFHDWLITHLTLGFVRLKTVTVTGMRLRPPR